MKPHFYCDLCNHQVAADQDACPYCGVKFSGVRCPSCNHQGTVAQFGSGCPSCGYQVERKEPFSPKHKLRTTKVSTPKPRYPWQLPIKDLSTIAAALVIATVAVFLFYHLHIRV